MELLKTFTIAFVFINLLAVSAHDRPVIGILTTTASDISAWYSSRNYSYIPYSYVQFIEAAGARVIPIPYDASPENLTYLFNQVNGILFTGGGAPLNYTDPETGKLGPANMTRVGDFLIRKVIEAKNEGRHVPLMTTCQGWEILVLAISKNYDILNTNYTDYAVSSSVQLTKDAFRSGPWASLPADLQNATQNLPLFYYAHSFALTVEDFYKDRHLREFLEVTGTSIPVNGGAPVFVAAAQGRHYPIWGHQFHPEKNAFLWKEGSNVSHAREAIFITQHYANFFVNEARKNNVTFESEQVLADSLIYNWNISDAGKVSSFDKAYLFPEVEKYPEYYPNLFPKHTRNNKDHHHYLRK